MYTVVSKTERQDNDHFMTLKTYSSLSTKRIIISLLLFIAIPVSIAAADRYINQWCITAMAAFNIFGSILCAYDWNLFAIHYNRSKRNMSDTLLYTVVGTLLIGMLYLINVRFLHGSVVIADPDSLTAFGYARFGMWIGFSFMQSLTLGLVYKCLTDRFEAPGNELQIILLTSFLFGFVYLVLFIPFSITVWLRTYFYNVMLIAIMSYLYNQSRSLIPGMLAMGIIYHAAMIF